MVSQITLEKEIKELIEKDFGVYSAAKIDDFAKEIDPEREPAKFIEKCVDFVATLLGREAAEKKLKSFYEKYT